MFSIGLLLALISVSAAVEVPGFFNSTQCVYLPTTRTFTCSFGERRVECSAVANFTVFGPTKYNLFGIARLAETFVNAPATTVNFALYPRSFDNITYVSSTVGTSPVVLYYGETFSNYGIRVIDPVCFGQIVELFGTVTDYHVITVGSTPVSLIGEVLYSDTTVAKRWLWGYGFGLGYPYFGWGGMGMYGLGMGLGYPGLFWGR